MTNILNRYRYHPFGGFRLVEDSISNVPIDSDQVNTWTDFLQDPQFNYYDKIQEIANLYPEVNTLEVNYWDIQKFNDEFAETFLKKPRNMIPNAEKAIADLCPADVEGEFHFRVLGLPAETARITLPDLRSYHLEKYIALEGLVRSTTDVRPRLTIAIFRCQKCGFNMRLPQEDNLLREPFRCVNENCDREAKQTSFELVKTVSEYVDLQMLNIQEPPEGLRGSAPPQRLKIFLRDDLCGKVSPGERIIVNGILFASQRKIANQKSTDFDLFIDAFAIEQEAVPYEEIQISEEDMNEINELAKNPLIYELIRDSIAPGIFEMDIIKEALVLQLFGGIAKDTETSHNRGDIHILLIGDPGTGKSQLLRYMSKIAPRGIFTSGKSTSAAGLCVAPDTLISLSSGELVEIGGFVEEKMERPELVRDGIWRQASNGNELETINPDLKLGRENLESVWRLRSPEELYEVRTRTNRKIVVSGNTPLPVRSNGSGMEWIKAKELAAGMYLATPRTLPEPKNPIPMTIELIELDCIVLGCGNLIRKIIERLKVKYTTTRKIAEKFNINENQLYHHWVRDDRRGNPTLGAILGLGEEVGCGYREVAKHVKHLSKYHGHKIKLPPKITQDLLYFTGLIAGDGAICRSPYGGYTIRFSNCEPSLMDKYVELCSSLFGITVKVSPGSPRRPPEGRFNSKIVAELLHKLGVPPSPKSHKIDISPIIQKLPNKYLASFLRGLYDCDGSCNFRTSGPSTVELYSSSYKLIRKLQILLLRFGMISGSRKKSRRGTVSRFIVDGEERRIESKNDIYVLTITGDANLRSFRDNIDFYHPKKKEELQKATVRMRSPHSNWDVVPDIGSLFKECRETLGVSHSKCGVSNAFETGVFNPSRKYLNKTLKRLEDIVLKEEYDGRKVVLPTNIQEELSDVVRSLCSNKELGERLGIPEYRAYELVHRKGRGNNIPILILDKVCSFISSEGYKELSETIYDLGDVGKFKGEVDTVKKKLGLLHSLAVSDIFWDQISGIRKVKAPEYIYDLTVKNSHNFIANGLLAHNTATAVKDELDGRWTIEGGALVLADRGLACIDEIDKMREEDRVAIHEALEQQSISFAKAGITATLMTRCSLLAAANPKEGRFTDDKSYPEQINLLPTLLSRFDLIFPIIDKPDEDKDHRLASKILDSHRAGQMRKNIEEKKEVDFSLEDAEQIARVEPAIPIPLLQKYVAYAKRNIYPVMTEEVKERLLAYYVTQRAMGKPREDEEGEVERITLTPRQLEGLIRLSEASAKLRLSMVVDMEDAERAITLFAEYLNRIARDRSGRLDIDTIMSGTTARKRSYGKIMRTTIQDIIKNPDIDTSQGVHVSDIKREAINAGIPEEEFDNLLKSLNDRGDIYTPADGYYRVTK